MTCLMAAGQQKKRLTSSHIREQYRGKKKKKLDSSDYVLNLKSHVDLDWDERHKSVVAKRGQVGLAWKDLAPFIDSGPQSHSGQADVFHVPREIFGLKDLSDVLSYETWATCLTESDRKLLSQFLPSGTSSDQVVKSLLKGENLHFGNQFTKWSASVCSGKMHPDIVLKKERQFRSNKNAYYVELNKYHSSMVEDLEKWKEKWLSCKDPEKLWSDASPSKPKQAGSAVAIEKAKVSKRETPQKIVRNSDTTKYMSYIKISSTQHEQVKNLKHSADGIQSKLLTNVLGDIKNYNVHSYASFMEEEKKKLHDYWLQVATKDLPEAFKAWSERRSAVEQLRRSLNAELADESVSISEQDEETQKAEEQEQEQQQEQKKYSSPDIPNIKEEEEEPELEHEQEQEEDLREQEEQEEEQEQEEEEQEQVHKQEEDEEPSYPETEHMELTNNEPSYPIDLTNGPNYTHHLERIPSLNSHHHETETFIPSDDPPPPPHPVLGDPLQQGNNPDKWDPVVSASATDSYYDPPVEEEMERVGSVIDLERDVNMIEMERDVGMIEMENGTTLFCQELIPSFRKDPEELLPPPHPQTSYSHSNIDGVKQQQQVSGLPFLLSSNRPPEPFQEQHQLLEQRQTRESNLYMPPPQSMNKAVYPTVPTRGYPNPGQQSTPVGPLPHQQLNPSRFSMNGSYNNNNWFPQDHQLPHQLPHSNWSAVDPSGSTSDGSLYSVLSECNKIPPRVQYNTSINTANQYVEPRNFSNIYGYAPPQMDSRGGNGNVAVSNMDNLGWMNFRGHNNNNNNNNNDNSNNNNNNQGMHDSMGRLFSRNWGR